MVTLTRILYIARGVKIDGKRAFPMSFYTEPTGTANYLACLSLFNQKQPKVSLDKDNIRRKSTYVN